MGAVIWHASQSCPPLKIMSSFPFFKKQRARGEQSSTSHKHGRQHCSSVNQFNMTNRFQSAELRINSYLCKLKKKNQKTTQQLFQQLGSSFVFLYVYIYVTAFTYFMHTDSVWKPSLLSLSVILIQTGLNFCCSGLQIWPKIACTSKFVPVTSTCKNKGRDESLPEQV